MSGRSGAGSSDAPSDLGTDGLKPLIDGAAEVLGRALVASEISSFSSYLSLILKWQSVHRLVGRSDPAWIAEELFLDSLTFLRVVPPSAKVIVDIGSGAGIPGIPIRIVRADVSMVLVESRRRRASFLSAVVRELGLARVRVVNARAESLLPELSRSADAIVMRSAGSATSIMSKVGPMIKPGGIAVASGPVRRDDRWRGEWADVVLSGGRRRLFAVLHM